MRQTANEYIRARSICVSKYISSFAIEKSQLFYTW